MLVDFAHWHFGKLYLTTEIVFLLPVSRWKGFGGLGFFSLLPKGKKLHEYQFSLNFL